MGHPAGQAPGQPGRLGAPPRPCRTWALPARLRSRLVHARVLRTGMGPASSQRAAAALLGNLAAARPRAAAVVVAGVAGALRSSLSPGDVVVADELRGGERPRASRDAASLADGLRGAGLSVHVGPVLSTATPRLWRPRGSAPPDRGDRGRHGVRVAGRGADPRRIPAVRGFVLALLWSGWSWTPQPRHCCIRGLSERRASITGTGPGGSHAAGLGRGTNSLAARPTGA